MEVKTSVGSIGEPFVEVGNPLGLRPVQREKTFDAFLAVAVLAASYFAFSRSLEERISSIPEKSLSPVLSCDSAVVTIVLVAFACLLYKHQNQPLLRWVINNKEVKILQKGNNLIHQVNNFATKEVTHKGVIVFDGPNIGDQIQYLKQCGVVFEDDGSPSFSKPVKDFSSCSMSKQHTILLKGLRGLIWHVYDSKDQRFWQLPFDKIKFEPLHASLSPIIKSVGAKNEEMEAVLNVFKRAYRRTPASNNACLEFLKDFGISGTARVRGNVANRGRRKAEACVKLMPLFKYGWFDDIVITRKMWAVALICSNGSNCDGNHAEIVIERYDGYLQVAHLVRNDSSNDQRGKILLHDAVAPRLEFTGRTQFWSVPKRKVKVMIEAIKEDMTNPPILTLRGGDAIFAGSHEENCFTWARKKLKILDIHIEKHYLDWVVAITSLYTPIPHYLNYLRFQNDYKKPLI